MSTERTLHCKVCDKAPTSYETTSKSTLSEIYRVRKYIVELLEHDIEGTLDITIYGSGYVGNLWEFLRDHKDHDMDIQDEYGRIEPL